MNNKPRRHIQAELRIGADSWDDLAWRLRDIAWQIEIGQHRSTAISGGPSSGYTWEATVDDAVTHDSYCEANAAYVETLLSGEANTESEDRRQPPGDGRP